MLTFVGDTIFDKLVQKKKKGFKLNGKAKCIKQLFAAQFCVHFPINLVCLNTMKRD